MRKFCMLLITLFFILSLDSATAALQGATKRGVTPEDYFSLKFIGDPQLSPDGKLVVYVLTTIDQKKNHRDSSIWLVTVDGSALPRRFSLKDLARMLRDGARMGKHWRFFLRETRRPRRARRRNRRSICCRWMVVKRSR